MAAKLAILAAKAVRGQVLANFSAKIGLAGPVLARGWFGCDNNPWKPQLVRGTTMVTDTIGPREPILWGAISGVTLPSVLVEL